MAIPYVKNTTWQDGSGGGTPITAATLNQIEQGIYDAHRMPAARVYHNANQSISNNTLTVLAFNSERFDTDTIHDTVTDNSRLTCKTAGKYLIAGSISWSGAPGINDFRLRVNGSTTIAIASADDSSAHGSIASIYDLAVNDYVELLVIQISGGSLNIVASGNHSPEFSMVRVA